jgi:hypothetical protein
MAEVSIDLDAMADLVKAIGNARTDVTFAAGAMAGNLDSVWLSTQPLASARYDGEIDQWLASSERDVNRRLSMARLIATSDPTMSVVSYDDSVLSDATDAEIKTRVDRVAELMKIDDDDLDPKAIDPELLKLLGDNALDPYFAKALAEKVGPDVLDRYLQRIGQTAMRPSDVDQSLEDYKKSYDELLGDLGAVYGLASQGTGSLEVKGMAQQWADLITKSSMAHTGTVPRLSLVVGRGLWSADFLTTTFTAIRDAEKDGATWNAGPMWDALEPGQDIPGYYTITDPLKGWFQAMQSSPQAMAKLFATGPMTTIEVDGQKVQVNKELYELMHDRAWAGDDGITPQSEQAITAFTDAIRAAIMSPPVAGQQAYQPLLAHDIGAIAQLLDAEAKEAEEKRGPVWVQIVDGVADLIGLVPIIGDAVDFVHGLTYFARGDNVNGALSMGAVVPFAGWAATGGKWVREAVKAEEIAELTAKGAQSVTVARIFGKDGKLLDETIDLTDPANFAPGRWLSPTEQKIFSGNREFIGRMIAGNRFNSFANANYKFSEISMAAGKSGHYRLDAWTPGEAIVSRKLTQLDSVTLDTAKGYIDEFVKKYPEGGVLADTAKNRDLGIAGQKLTGDMVLEVPPQVGGKISDTIKEYAESQGVFIRDINGHWLTDPPS